MKKLTYITAFTLSLLIIYMGAGISIMQFCSSSCEVMDHSQSGSCSKCDMSKTCNSKSNCKDEGCTTTIYKLDVMKHTSETLLSVPMITLFCATLNPLFSFFSLGEPVDHLSLPSPPPLCSRHILALHTVLLI